jgi:hypothetical protein
MYSPSFWSIENGEIKRNEVQLSAERRAEIQNKISAKFHARAVKEPILCAHCHKREVEYRGRNCFQCAAMLDAAHRETDAQAEYQNMLIRLVVAILFIGAGMALVSWLVS